MMTRKELRDYVEEQRNLDVIPYHVYSALIDGIDTLEQEPCEDAISRQAYIERYRTWGYSEYGRKIDNEELAIRVAMSLPPVTPQPKTGHWEYGYAFTDGNYCKCSECKEIIKCIYPMHYCPNCGCRMVEPQESEDKKCR